MVAADRKNMTIRELVMAYGAHREKRWAAGNRGEQNIKSWKAHSSMMLTFFGDKTLSEICEGDELRNLCHRYIAARSSVSNATIRKQLATLNSPLRWAWEQRWITGLPPMHYPPADSARDRKLTSQEVARLIEIASSYPTERHLKLCILLSLFTPANRYAISNLTWDRVDFTRGTIAFDGRGDQRRLVAEMNDVVRAAMTEASGIRDPECKYVISWRGKKVENPYHGLRAVFERAGLNDITFNDLRRWSGSVEDDDVEESDEADPSPRLVISYCTKDGMSRAAALCDELETLSIGCWIAPRDIKAGPYPGQIIEAIEAAEGLVVVLTAAANESRDVLQEVNAAKNAKKVILPVIVGPTVPSPNLRYYLNVPQQTKWTDAPSVAEALKRLLD